MLYALLFLPALAGIAYVVLRRRPPRVLAAAATAAPAVSDTAVPSAAPVLLEAPPAELEEAAAPALDPPPVVLREAVPEPAAQISGDADPLQALETLLAELERATLDERDVAELERLAEQLEATARELERVG